MNAKYKARQLVDKFSDLEDGEMYIVKAKQCALIAVQRNIDMLKDLKYQDRKSVV